VGKSCISLAASIRRRFLTKQARPRREQIKAAAARFAPKRVNPSQPENGSLNEAPKFRTGHLWTPANWASKVRFRMQLRHLRSPLGFRVRSCSRACQIRSYQSLHQARGQDQSVKSCTRRRVWRYWGYAPDFVLGLLRIFRHRRATTHFGGFNLTAWRLLPKGLRSNPLEQCLIAHAQLQDFPDGQMSLSALLHTEPRWTGDLYTRDREWV
jgi:hypothetical protein